MFTKQLIDSALSYEAYRKLTEDLYAQGKVSTTGDNNTPDMLHYVHLNMARMSRLDKTVELLPEVHAMLDNMATPELWIVISEGWCGDAAQIVPVIHKVAEAANGKIDLRFLLRDEHPEIIDAFLTSGGRAIPKLIRLNPETLDVLGSWGPRPVPAQQFVDEMKIKAAETNMPFKELVAAVHKWYADDKTLHTQQELAAL